MKEIYLLMPRSLLPALKLRCLSNLGIPARSCSMGKSPNRCQLRFNQKSQLRINLCLHYHKIPCAGLCLAPDVVIQDHFTSQNDSSALCKTLTFIKSLRYKWNIVELVGSDMNLANIWELYTLADSWELQHVVMNRKCTSNFGTLPYKNCS